jgi:hypothetical protein
MFILDLDESKEESEIRVYKGCNKAVQITLLFKKPVFGVVGGLFRIYKTYYIRESEKRRHIWKNARSRAIAKLIINSDNKWAYMDLRL